MEKIKEKKLIDLLKDIIKLAIYQNSNIIIIINFITNIINEEIDSFISSNDAYREEERRRDEYETYMRGGD